MFISYEYVLLFLYLQCIMYMCELNLHELRFGIEFKILHFDIKNLKLKHSNELWTNF